jgi:hypothetical protein
MKPNITDIGLNEQQVKQLNDILVDVKQAKQTRVNFVKERVHGWCSICSKVPQKIVTWQLDGVQVIERYCNECFDRNKKKIFNAKRDRQ